MGPLGTIPVDKLVQSAADSADWPHQSASQAHSVYTELCTHSILIIKHFRINLILEFQKMLKTSKNHIK